MKKSFIVTPSFNMNKFRVFDFKLRVCELFSNVTGENR